MDLPVFLYFKKI